MLLLAVLDHDDVITELGLDCPKRRSGNRAGRQLKSHLLELGIQAPLGLPAERAACR
jgi:hypothetical protein